MFYGGEVLDNTYQIIKEIGKGGTGVVYLAYHLRLQKYVVVKKIHDNFVGQVNVRTEVDILKSLHHTGLPQVYDFFQLSTEVYTVMEHIRGYDLQHYLDEGCEFEEKDLIRWLLQLCEVLEYLHARVPPVLHSDIKPGNIMITPEGNICLIDFNISLDSREKADVRGMSKWYAAPEQVEKAVRQKAGEDTRRIVLDGRMDIYSLGAAFYRLMTGRIPTQDSREFIPVTAMDLPYSQALKAIVGKAMEWDIRKRYSSAAAMHKALLHIYRSDSEYKKLRILNICLYTGCGLLFLLGIWSTAYGWKGMCREDYEKDYAEFYSACENYDNETIISTGIDMLNNKKYKTILENDGQEKAGILYELGNASFEQEQYETAADYYQEARTEDPKTGVYYRDEAIARARSGDIYQASYVLEQADMQGTEDEDILLAKQEIAFTKKEYSKVTEIGEQLEDTGKAEIAGRSALLAAAAFEEKGDMENQLLYLEKAYKAEGGTRCLRQIGQTCLELAQQQKQSRHYKEYLQKGQACYVRLQENPLPSFTDSFNLAIIWELEGEYRKSYDMLKNLSRSNPDSYMVYMHLSYICCKQEEQKKVGMRDFEKAKKYYEKAKILYRSGKAQSDSAMKDLENIIEQMDRE
nr:protein kinase [uncultured Blautia sp.]